MEKKEDEPLPPRSRVHPSNKMKLIRIFYRVLVGAFLLLTGGLIAWGFQLLE